MDESAEGMPHAAKEGTVIYSEAFVGLPLSDFMFYCADVCYLNLCTTLLFIGFFCFHAARLLCLTFASV